MKKISTVLLVLIAIFSFSSCNTQSIEQSEKADSISTLSEESVAAESIKPSVTIRSNPIAETEGIREYKEDYISKYKSTFDAMFDKQWTVITTKNKYEDPKEICEHVDTRPQQFIQWTIEYHDGNDEIRTFIFDNRQSMSDQIADYIKYYIADYYEKNFFDVCVKNLPVETSGYVYVNLARISIDRNEEENLERATKSDEYLEKLDTPEGTICLSKLTPANVFEMCPIYLSINVSFRELPEGKKSFEENAEERVVKMIEDMNKFSKNHLTASISMGYHDIIFLENGDRECYWNYIQGKQVYNEACMFFERRVFDGYKGMFW